MIDIKPEALCTYCEKLNDTKRDGCGGEWCDSSYASYMEAHGLEENSATTFENLRIGDTVYMISANRLQLFKCDVVGIRVSDESNLCISLRGMNSPIVSKNSSKTTDNTLFINKQDAIDEYKRGIFVIIEEMMDTVRNI